MTPHALQRDLSMPAPTEKELDLVLASELENNAAFLEWFISHTKFFDRGARYSNCRTNHPWGTHPFPITDPVTGATETTMRQSETDVLLVLSTQDGRLLGVHIENKIGVGKFTARQPEMYPHRAAHWLGNAKYGNYSEFDTVLLAPRAFRERNESQAGNFGCFIAHEDVAQFIPMFRQWT